MMVSTHGVRTCLLRRLPQSINLEFCLGNPRLRKVAVFKINLLIKILTAFRDSLLKEIALIEKESKAK